MARPGPSELVFIRHAPADHGGRLCGRTDVDALVDQPELPLLRVLLAKVPQRVTSPARRCVQTAQALWPKAPLPETDARLWEQNFGDHDGMALGDLPDLGVLPNSELAQLRPPQGESFADMVARVHPAVQALSAQAVQGGPLVVVAHAGTVRAAIALATGDLPGALNFEIAPLSITRLRCFRGGLSVICTNWTAP